MWDDRNLLSIRLLQSHASSNSFMKWFSGCNELNGEYGIHVEMNDLFISYHLLLVTTEKTLKFLIICWKNVSKHIHKNYIWFYNTKPKYISWSIYWSEYNFAFVFIEESWTVKAKTEPDQLIESSIKKKGTTLFIEVWNIAFEKLAFVWINEKKYEKIFKGTLQSNSNGQDDFRLSGWEQIKFVQIMV